MRISTNIKEHGTFEEAAAAFLRFKQANQISKRTMDDYIKTFKKFAAVSSNTMEFETLSSDLLVFFSQIPDTSPAVFNRPFSNLNALFNWCVKQDMLQKNPLAALDLHKKKDEGNITAASIDDIKAVLKACNRSSFTGLRNYTIILLMLDTGIRTAELTRLVNSDYDAAAKTITITKDKAKTRKQRICYLSDNTAAALNRYLRHKPSDIPLIFPSRDANQLETNEIGREFRNLCKKANVKITPYQLRHSFATYFIENGGNVFILQNLMGHSDIRMTMRYTDISEKQKREAHTIYSPSNLLAAKTRL